MIRKLPFKMLSAVMLLSSIAFANSIEEKPKVTLEKTIEKSFEVNSNATLKIHNSYGNVDVITWNENRIEFDITIKVTSSKEDKAQEKLDDIDVKFSASRDWVAAETMFNKGNKKSWWSWGSSNKVKMEINYTIKIPASNNVNLNNDYGNITVDRLEGKAEINCDYGKITTKELMADNNIINFDYSKGCYFEYVKSGKLNADYSSYTIAKTKELAINADYTESTIEAAEDINYNCDYGSLTVQNVNNFEGNGDYLNIRLGNVYKDVSIKADYGSIKIDKMTSNAGNLSIDTDYAGMNIGLDSGYSFDFELNLEYAGLRGGDDFEFSQKRVESSKKFYSGYKGKASSGNMIKINSDYGSVTFK